MKTNYFAHCWGVFEGGGVRVAAHAGAFFAARESGVVFSRVAGTSGGSVVAALIAAGASPEYITDELSKINFPDFLSPLNKDEVFFNKLPLYLRLLRKFSCGALLKFLNLATFAGLHNSKKIEEWVDSKLQSIVKTRRKDGVTGPVCFSELLIPLHVVATDCANAGPKVWSLEHTPSVSVAYAVRCSCAVPFFFQPIKRDNSLFIDGGVLSNLPAFVFEELIRNGDARNVLSRILAFRLVENSNSGSIPKDAIEFGKAIANAAIQGTTHIQTQLQSNIHSILIQTESVPSMDFMSVDADVRKKLYESGKRSVKKFLNEERLNAKNSLATTAFQGFDEKLLLLVQELSVCTKSFFSSGRTTYWFDFVFPSLLLAARRGIQIVIFTLESQCHDELRRQSLLKQLGAKIIVQNKPLPFEGFAFDINQDKSCAIFASTIANDGDLIGYESEIIRLYTRDFDPAIFDLLLEKLKCHLSESVVEARSLPFIDCCNEKLFNRLRTISMYSEANFQMREIGVDENIWVLQQGVKEFKFLQIRNLMKDLKDKCIDYFSLKEVQLLDGSGSIVTPPILERVGEKFILIDGNSRFFQCMAMGVNRVHAVIVDNVSAALPTQTQPRPLSSLKIMSSTTNLNSLYSGHIDKSLFRRIEEAAHPYSIPYR